METSLPTPMTARVYVNLPEGISSESLRKKQHQEHYVDLLLERQLITLDDAATFKEVDGGIGTNMLNLWWPHVFLSQKPRAFHGFDADFLWDFIECFGSFWDIMRFSQPILWFYRDFMVTSWD